VVALEGLPAPPLFGPSLSPDGRTLFFAASGDIFSARRAQIRDTVFFDVRPLSVVNSNQPELTPHLSRDGRTLYFARDSDGSGFFRDLMQTGRPSPGDPFGNPSALSQLNDPFYSELSPWLSADREELWFSSSRPGGPGLFDIWRARRSNQGGGFDNPQPIGSLSSPEDDSGLALTSAGLTAALSSSRSGTLGERDLWLATRATRVDDFTVDSNLSELNSAQNDTDPTWRSDDAELLFASDRTGESLLYSAARPCLP
jgi:Tol biopolymer transport system component